MGIPFRYNVRNLFRRKMRTFLTVLGISLVVAVSCIMLAFSRGLLYSLRNNGDPDNVLILSKKAEDRIFSLVERGHYGQLAGILGDRIKKVAPEKPPETEDDEFLEDPLPVMLVAGYIYHTAGMKIKGGIKSIYGEMQAMILGVDTLVGFHMNSKYKLVKGREIEEGAREAMVGRLVYARLGVQPEDVAVGKIIIFNNNEWKIVGWFAAPGTSAEGEIWVPIKELASAINRQSYSYVVVKLENKDDVPLVAEEITAHERVELKAMSEVEFYVGFAETFSAFAAIGIIMALIITVGGIMAGMNTMYTAVSGRIREIGMLQVIGFNKKSIVISFLAESVILALASGVIGCSLGLLINGMPMKVTMGVFKFRVDGLVIGASMFFALVIGVVGALVPALGAVRLRMVDAMRYQ